MEEKITKKQKKTGEGKGNTEEKNIGEDSSLLIK
jgi:hypothetical protein